MKGTNIEWQICSDLGSEWLYNQSGMLTPVSIHPCHYKEESGNLCNRNEHAVLKQQYNICSISNSHVNLVLTEVQHSNHLIATKVNLKLGVYLFCNRTLIQLFILVS